MNSREFLSFLLLILLFFPRSSLQFPRWVGDKKTGGSVLELKPRGFASGFDPSRVTQLSWHPRAFLYNGFLSEEECDHLITLAKDKLEKSMVADNDSGKSIASEVRTSSGMFLQKGQDEVVANVEAKIAAWTFLPAENGESIQILHYENGEKYEPHFDYFHDKVNQQLGGHRIATVLMYLSTVEKGGETVFPNSEQGFSQPKDDSLSDCAKRGYAESVIAHIFCCTFALSPKKGDALLFFSLHPDATTDPSSLHGSCPVIAGEKWSATKWIHVRSFDKSLKPGATGECVDEDEHCPKWASVGECEKNPVYMPRRVSTRPLGSLEIEEEEGDGDEITESEKVSEIKKTIKNHMIVATLIATVTFAAGFTLPGGYIESEGDHQGMAVLSIRAKTDNKQEKDIADSARENFLNFVREDGIAMVLSICAIGIYFLASFPNSNKKKVRAYLGYGAILTMAAMVVMVFAFIDALQAVLHQSLPLEEFTFLMLALFVFLFGIPFVLAFIPTHFLVPFFFLLLKLFT